MKEEQDQLQKEKVVAEILKAYQLLSISSIKDGIIQKDTKLCEGIAKTQKPPSWTTKKGSKPTANAISISDFLSGDNDEVQQSALAASCLVTLKRVEGRLVSIV